MHGDRLVLYRAMSPAERDATLAAGAPVFLHGHKFFSDDLGWIASRVRDGAFRGRTAAPDDYDHVLSFTVTGAHRTFFRKLNAREFMLKAEAARWLEAEIAEVTAGEIEAGRLRAIWASRAA